MSEEKTPESASKRGRGRPPGPSERTKAQIAAYADLGTPPEDPLEANEWMLKVLQRSMLDVINDSGIKSKQRRSELRQIARSCAALTPNAELAAARRELRDAQKQREEPRAEPKLDKTENDDAPVQVAARTSPPAKQEVAPVQIDLSPAPADDDDTNE